MYQHCEEEYRDGSGKRDRRLKSETKTSSGPVSSERARGILSATRPSLGRLNLARQEKLQVTAPQASLPEEHILIPLYLLV